MMKWYRFLLFRGYRLEPDPLTSCNDEFTIGALLTIGSLTDAPSIIIKENRIIIRGWPMFTIAEQMFQEVIEPDTYFRFYLDEHPDYMTRGAWYSPFQWVHLPLETASYSRSYLSPKVLKGRLLIIETKLLREAKEAGCKCVGGKGMLLWQGVAAFKLFTGKDMPVEEVKARFFSVQ